MGMKEKRGEIILCSNLLFHFYSNRAVVLSLHLSFYEYSVVITRSSCR